jgi:hypothetical protein
LATAFAENRLRARRLFGASRHRRNRMMDSFGVLQVNLYPTPSQLMLALVGSAGGLLYGYNIGKNHSVVF